LILPFSLHHLPLRFVATPFHSDYFHHHDSSLDAAAASLPSLRRLMLFFAFFAIDFIAAAEFHYAAA